MQKTDEKEPERLLILCVDRDNDVGRKTDIKTPIIGKKENTEAAVKLILTDPEEADANAMFEAIRIYDDLGKDETNRDLYQVVTIAGSELGGITADRKLVSELADVLKSFQASSLILVTDGFAEEEIIPLIQSRVPVTSVRRVVVKHSESIEETAAVFSRYLRMLVEDPRYSRIALGLPGVLMIALGVLSFLAMFIRYDIGTWAWIVGLIIVGSYLLGKGYGLDKKISILFSRMYHASLSGLVAGFSLVTGLILASISFYQAWSYIAANPEILPTTIPTELGKLLELIPRVTGWLISRSLTMVIIGVCIIFLGRSLGYLLERDSRFWRTTALVVICAWSWSIFNETSKILVDPSLPPDTLIASIIIGIIIIVASSLSTHYLGKIFRKFFKENMKEKEMTQN